MTRLALASVLVLAATACADDPSVGVPTRIAKLVLPGSELEPKPPADRNIPLILRVVRAEKVEGGFRYDLEYYALEPGTYDLRDFLRRKDGTPVGDVPAIPITVRSVLPPGQIEPHALTPSRTPFLGGYRTALIAGGILWGLGLLAILFVGRKRKRAAEVEAVRPPTVADRLRPLVEGAMAGRLRPEQLADLERTLIGYWERRLGLIERPPVEALRELRRHPEAGPLLTQLERWLHAPAGGDRVDVTALLRPYQNVPAEEIDRVIESVDHSRAAR